eukprot:TRINITY_DN4685_c0_g1_i3.p1 TRINITY_DN4685_c0_g1~~TRINITY_DN4685_c0_g1_i3.p1  ORF type:complete len:310 (+),score=-33.73 TRINITY_DN4685_c0_g1_i3:64-993(+)
MRFFRQSCLLFSMQLHKFDEALTYLNRYQYNIKYSQNYKCAFFDRVAYCFQCSCTNLIHKIINALFSIGFHSVFILVYYFHSDFILVYCFHSVTIFILISFQFTVFILISFQLTVFILISFQFTVFILVFVKQIDVIWLMCLCTLQDFVKCNFVFIDYNISCLQIFFSLRLKDLVSAYDGLQLCKDQEKKIKKKYIISQQILQTLLKNTNQILHLYVFFEQVISTQIRKICKSIFSKQYYLLNLLFYMVIVQERNISRHILHQCDTVVQQISLGRTEIFRDIFYINVIEQCNKYHQEEQKYFVTYFTLV